MIKYKVLAIIFTTVFVLLVFIINAIFPENIMMNVDVILLIINMVILILLYVNLTRLKLEFEKTFVTAALVFTVLKGVVLIIEKGSNLDINSGLGVLDYAPGFIFLTSLLTLYRLGKYSKNSIR